MDKLGGKVAVITGGASGIGLAMAHRFGGAGMQLVIADVETGPLERAAGELRDEGHEVLAVPTDVTDRQAVEELAVGAFEKFGTVHVVCNNAGVGPPGGILETELSEWEWIMGVNFWGVLHGVRAFAPQLIDQGEGHIVNTASVAGLLTQPGMAAYNVSKHAVVALSEALYYELELLQSPVGVSVVCPAWVRTGIASSERNRPQGSEAPEGPITDRIRAASTALYDKARRGPDDIAARVVDAVRRQQFYVITHPGIMPFVEHRHEDIRLQRNPSVEQGL